MYISVPWKRSDLSEYVTRPKLATPTKHYDDSETRQRPKVPVLLHAMLLVFIWTADTVTVHLTCEEGDGGLTLVVGFCGVRQGLTLGGGARGA